MPVKTSLRCLVVTAGQLSSVRLIVLLMGAKTLSVKLNNHYSYVKVKFTSNTHAIRREYGPENITKRNKAALNARFGDGSGD